MEIDVRGLSCPEPVLIVMDAMDENPKERLVVLSDAAHTRDNIVKLAQTEGRRASVTEKGRLYEIVIE
ncbi:MAG: sulfurtransferase TusA family protein [Lachnospiraceae bacterium]|nr:sulfurtransferase TusA family protein [Lachnospiraceae bacterium]